jgi:hypothetical protein
MVIASLKEHEAGMKTAVVCLCWAFELKRVAGVQDRRLRADDGTVSFARTPTEIELRVRLRAFSLRRFAYRRPPCAAAIGALHHEPQTAIPALREERLAVGRRSERNRALKPRSMSVPQLTSDRWSLDFLADQFTDEEICTAATKKARCGWITRLNL